MSEQYTQLNPKALGVMNISLGLFIVGFYIDKVITKTAGIAGYLLLIVALLLIATGIHKYLANKAQPLIQDKRLGYINLFIGLLFEFATFANWYNRYNMQLPLYALALTSVAGIISIIIGLKLITKTN